VNVLTAQTENFPFYKKPTKSVDVVYLQGTICSLTRCAYVNGFGYISKLRITSIFSAICMHLYIARFLDSGNQHRSIDLGTVN